jgi:hypothetical protein
LLPAAPLYATQRPLQQESPLHLSTTPTSTRASFVSSIVTTIGSSLFVALPQSAQAAKYGSFGTDSTTGAITPQTAEIDTDLLKSSSVKDAINAIQKARTAVTTVQTTLQSNPQSSVIATSMIGDPYKIRESCNVINTILDEDTQRYTDRLIRNIVQDLIEIDIAAAQKDGIARSTRRYDNVQNKLTKLAKSIDELLAFTV